MLTRTRHNQEGEAAIQINIIKAGLKPAASEVGTGLFIGEG
jgi:hypothetical protein